MNERRLLVLAAVGASVVAYVVYALLSRTVAAPPEPEPTRAVAAGETSPGSVAERDRKQPPRKARRPGKRRPAPALGGPPPPLPMPDISLEEARENFGDLLAELKRELERNKETGKALANEHWIEYYRRGHEVMTPLRRYLGQGTQEEKAEVSGKDEELRELMNKLQLDPTKLEDEAEPESAGPEGP